MTVNLDLKVTGLSGYPSAFYCTLNTHYRIVSYRIIDALDILCAQLTRDLFAIAKFLFMIPLSRVQIRVFRASPQFFFTKRRRSVVIAFLGGSHQIS